MTLRYTYTSCATYCGCPLVGPVRPKAEEMRESAAPPRSRSATIKDEAAWERPAGHVVGGLSTWAIPVIQVVAAWKSTKVVVGILVVGVGK
jgi:hypothetical protein